MLNPELEDEELADYLEQKFQKSYDKRLVFMNS